MGAAKFLRGLVRRVDPRQVTVVVNTGDDEHFYGLHVSPDVDTVIYTLAGVINREHGWGLEGETFNALDALGRLYGKPWFNLGDRDFATHLYRTERLHAGARLTDVTTELAQHFGVKSRILPMSDDRVHTFVKLKGRTAIPFQEYFVRGRARGAVEAIELRGAEKAKPTRDVLDATQSATAIVIAPSNPFVSIGPILALAGLR
ncbi:MAG: 2-phospho-L-lactate transferase, partial [Candidatus Binataceae bacterium]|nr:2-phospho-L-lactate transferase [Candidatus Binataceae bacterium]